MKQERFSAPGLDALDDLMALLPPKFSFSLGEYLTQQDELQESCDDTTTSNRWGLHVRGGGEGDIII